MTIEIINELEVFKMHRIKPNYSALARKHNLSRDTIRKYNNGYEGKPSSKPKASSLDPLYDLIKSKMSIVGMTVSGLYHYLEDEKGYTGTESNLRKYITKHKLKIRQESIVHPRYETKPGYQL